MNNVLFIDDDKLILESYKKIFSTKKDNQFSSQFNILEASQGEDGVSIIKERLDSNDPIKVAFIDMRMPPGIDGAETARRIRDLDPRVEIVIVTAYSDLSLGEIVDEIGSPDKLLYLKKPFDIKEIRQLALNLTQKYKSEKVKEDFLSNISHELNTPLASIIGFQQLLEVQVEDDAEAMEYLKYMKVSIGILKSLIGELVTTIDHTQNGIHLQKEDVDVHEMLNEIYQAMKPIFELSDVEFKMDVSRLSGDAKLEIDKCKITQCLMNLIQNSKKFTPEGEIVIGAREDMGELLLYVKDTGLGIPKEKSQFIFERFSRLENKHHQIPGLGLGLSIVKNIIDSHDGKILLESEPGEGTTFYLQLTQINKEEVYDLM